MEYRLEELFDLQMGKTPSRSVTEYWESGNNKWISIADLSKCGKYIYDTKECLSDIAVSESGIKQIPANTVVMSFKLSIGKTAITSEPMYSNEAIMSFRDRKLVQLLPEYIYYLLLSKNWDDGTNKAVMGKTLNKATLSKVKVNIHSMQEQQEIVYVLNQATALIELHQQQLQRLDELVKARFVELFGDPIVNSCKLPVVTLGEISGLITKGASPSWQGFSYINDKSQTLFVTSENVREGCLDLSSPKYVEDGFNVKQKRSVIHKGDFLINIVGASIGRAAQFNLDCKANMNQASALVRIKDRRINEKYLLTYLNSDKAQRMYDSMKSDTGRANLSLQDISNLSILLPPIKKQIEFDQFVNQVDKSKVAVQKSLDEAQLLFDSLMQQYFE
jgi:type I restriction enzyme S subunit